MANNLANYGENATMDWLMGGATPSRPSARYIALHTADPTESGATGELSGLGYARQVATFAASSGGSTSNSGAVTFGPASGSWGTITYGSIWDAVSSGNCLWQGAITNKAVASGDSYQFAAAAFVVTLD